MRQQATGVPPDRRRALLEHDARDVAEAADLACVAGVDRQPSQRDDAGGVEHGGSVPSVFEGEASVEHRERLGEPPGSEQHAAVPGLEHLVGPALAVALRGGQAVGSDREGLLVPVADAQQLAMPHVREPEALVVAGEDPVAVGGRDQVERRVESVVGVVERALGDPQRERRPSVAGRRDRRARLVEHRARLVDAARGDEVVEEAREVAGAQARRKIGEVRGQGVRR